MAAEDDRISRNRRRLFKALSAVPVVSTLRPGSALAQNSSLQCLAKIREDVAAIEGPVVTGSSVPTPNFTVVGDANQIVEELFCWIFTEDSRQPRGTNGFVGLAGIPRPPFVVVDMNQAGGGPYLFLIEGRLRGRTGSDFDSEILTDGAFKELAPNGAMLVRRAPNLNGNQPVALVAQREVAAFARVGASIAGPSGEEDYAFEFLGTYPEAGLGQRIGAGPGENQINTWSCMDSMPNATMASINNG